MIPFLNRLGFGQWVRTDGPSRHLKKTGTPTMGGLIILVGALGGLLVFLMVPEKSPADWAEGLAVLLVAWGFGAVGFLDDFLKVVYRRPLGLKARQKLLGQVTIALILAVVAVFILGRGTDLPVPFSGFLVPGGYTLELSWWIFLGFTVLVLVGTANAVNLTDGLDGLLAGAFIISAVTFAAIALVLDKTSVAVILGALAGACAGFLYFNFYPARVFMGDTGSLALGGALAAAAVVTKSELFLLVIGGIFVVETLSVILQVIYYQITRRRIFRMSPLHHHFELLGWSERRVVLTFWVSGLVFSLLGLAGLFRLG